MVARVYSTLLLCCVFLGLSGQQVLDRSITWLPFTETPGNQKVFAFVNSCYDNYLPFFSESVSSNSSVNLQYELTSYTSELISFDSVADIAGVHQIADQFNISTCLRTSPGGSFAEVRLMPLRVVSGKVERILTFKLTPVIIKSSQTPLKTTTWSSSSVLASGTWSKIKVQTDGVYKLTYAQLTGLGISDPGNIRIYGNGGKMLPQLNSKSRPDDLLEIPLMFIEAQSGTFKEGDYVLFYAEGPTSWEYSTSKKMYLHKQHLYADGSYYFITSGLGRGRTVGVQASSTKTPTAACNSFDDFAFHESDLINICESNSNWFGELFDSHQSHSFSFTFPNILSGTSKIYSVFASQSYTPTTIELTANGAFVREYTLPRIYSLECDFEREEYLDAFIPSGDNLSLKYTFDNNGSSAAKAYMDKVDVNVRRSLVMSGTQMLFRDMSTIDTGNVTTFTLSNVSSNTEVWEVTCLWNSTRVQGSVNGSSYSFVLETDSLRKFIAFDKTNALTPVITGTDVGAVATQNLHGMAVPNYLIVYHPTFSAAAEKLAAYRRAGGFTVETITPQQIYNEFSSGSTDIQAIRDFARMLYAKAPAVFRYMLLIGDGSFDNRPLNMEGNPNFIPTYESANQSGVGLVTDDFFALLDENEDGLNGHIDVGIGRFPVGTEEEANDLVDKIIGYDSSSTFGSWRNQITLVADDNEDLSFHFLPSSEIISDSIKSVLPGMNANKIYLDAYKQYISAAGQTCPDADLALHSIIHKGTMLINYTGHGGPEALTSENLVTKSVIDTWNNKDRLFMLLTAACKFSRFDLVEYNKNKVIPVLTAGEKAFLKKDGGAICMITTTRDTYEGANTRLNTALIRYLTDRPDSNHQYRLGDIYRLTKNAAGSDFNTRAYVLFGDPCMHFAIPDMDRIRTDSINGKVPGQDTIKALSDVVLKGHVVTRQGIADSSFNGAVTITIFDKPIDWITVDNHGYGVDTFPSQENAIIKGNASVRNGYFSFHFITPKDINYLPGNGKISYYAQDGKTELNGYNDTVKVGLLSNTGTDDMDGPAIKLYMNDTTFESGDITNDSPTILAILTDECGINATGASIGHDIVATIDNNDEQKYILNDYYESDLDNFRQGKVKYTLQGIAPGRHTLKMKVWDAMNNSAEAEIEFVVMPGEQLTIHELHTYPNPMTDYTSFIFHHNMPGEDMIVTIHIFDMSGQLMQSLKATVNSSTFTSVPIEWDGTFGTGVIAGQGMYLYRADVEIPDKNISGSSHGKLIIVR